MLALLLDSINPKDYLPSEDAGERISTIEKPLSPLAHRGNIPETP